MKRRGRGIACMWYPIGFTVAANPSAAVVKVNEDGTATLLTGTVETGQGSLTILAQIVAEELGIATDRRPRGVGRHRHDADGHRRDREPHDVRHRQRGPARRREGQGDPVRGGRAGARREAAASSKSRDHKIQVKGFPQRNIHIGDVADRARGVNGQPPIGSASFNPATVALDPETGQGKPFATYVYATQIAEVDVDDETGEVEVLRIVASHDCGTPINPMLVEGQVEGGISMGVGFALQEEMLFDSQGRQINPNLTNYIMPTSLDMPKIEVDIVDSYDPTGPFGAKGVGEPTCVATAAAILNAIHDAVGVRITSLPATAEKVHAAIKAKRAQETRQLTA